MRISDWSSDVCSSDLCRSVSRRLVRPALFALEVGFLNLGLKFQTAALTAVGKRRSEEHTSELQSLMRISYAVFCLKKKKHKTNTITNHNINHKQYTHVNINTSLTTYIHTYSHT